MKLEQCSWITTDVAHGHSVDCWCGLLETCGDGALPHQFVA